jgi:hypothetical protein
MLFISAACVRRYVIWKGQARSIHAAAPGGI